MGHSEINGMGLKIKNQFFKLRVGGLGIKSHGEEMIYIRIIIRLWIPILKRWERARLLSHNAWRGVDVTSASEKSRPA